MRRVVVLLAVLCVCVCDGVRFGQLCSGNSDNSRRTSDSWGAGNYGARRWSTAGRMRDDTVSGQICSEVLRGVKGNRNHQGLDIRCSDGSAVYAPFDVTLHGKVTVYTDPAKAAINNGINLRGEGLCFKLFYVNPIQTSGSVRKGERIGTMLPMQRVYPGITSHVHVQMCDSKIDPTQYF